MKNKIRLIEENARDVINFLDKNGLRMILFKKEFSWNYGNYAKITDGKTIVEYWISNIIPPLESVKEAFRIIERERKRAE
jgi:hypothetical protein